MFHIAKNGIITLTRGDTCSFPISLNIGTPLSPIIFDLQEGDKVVFKLMRANEKSEDALLTKKYTINDLDEEGNIIVSFDSNDTLFLEDGVYFYEMKIEYIRNGNDFEYVNTFIPRTRFYIVN